MTRRSSLPVDQPSHKQRQCTDGMEWPRFAERLDRRPFRAQKQPIEPGSVLPPVMMLAVTMKSCSGELALKIAPMIWVMPDAPVPPAAAS
jgi:hypothetical protein